MTNPNLTEIVGVVDKSGSMNDVIVEARSGLRQFVEDQKKCVGQAKLTLTFFDTQFDKRLDGADIQNVVIKDDDYVPSGMTALLDAVGKTIDEVGQRLDKTPEEQRPSQVIFFILTDGQENSSSEYTRDRVKQMIQTQEGTYNWKFIYLGANQNAFEEAEKLGAKRDLAATFAATSKGVSSAFAGASVAACCFRMGGDRSSASRGLSNTVVSNDPSAPQQSKTFVAQGEALLPDDAQAVVDALTGKAKKPEKKTAKPSSAKPTWL